MFSLLDPCRVRVCSDSPLNPIWYLGIVRLFFKEVSVFLYATVIIEDLWVPLPIKFLAGSPCRRSGSGVITGFFDLVDSASLMLVCGLLKIQVRIDLMGWKIIWRSFLSIYTISTVIFWDLRLSSKTWKRKHRLYEHYRVYGDIIEKGIVGIRSFRLYAIQKCNKGSYHKDIINNNYRINFGSLPCLEFFVLNRHLEQVSPHCFMLLNTRTISFLFLLLSSCKLLMENSAHSVGSDGCANIQHDKLTPEDLLELCLVGSVLTSKTIRFNVLKDMLAKMWQPGQSMDITKIDENRFLFQFYHHWDLERVLEGGPWLYDNFMLATRKLKFGEDPLAVPLDEVEVWVQIHQLPFGFMTEDVGVLIGNHIGKFVGYDTYNNYPVWRKYMRIKVAINVQLPLKKSWVFDRVEGEKVYLVFKFEKLGTFYFLCGIIGHSEKFCPKKLCPNLPIDANGWGNFLRAESIVSGDNGGENKWLRNGRRSKESSHNSQSNAESLNGVVGEHMLYGRVAIDRDPISRKLVFFKIAGRIGENSNNWTAFSPTDKGDALNANGDTESVNRKMLSNVTDLAAALENKMLVSDVRSPTMESVLPSAMQLINSSVTTPSKFSLRDATNVLPTGSFKVFENKIFLNQNELNNTAAATTLMLTDGQTSNTPNQFGLQVKTNSFNAKEFSEDMLIPFQDNAAEPSKQNRKADHSVNCKETVFSKKCEDGKTEWELPRPEPILFDSLQNSAVSSVGVVSGKAKGTQLSTSKSKVTATKVSMKNQARRKPHQKALTLSDYDFHHDRDMISLKKRFRSDERDIAELSEQNNNGPAAANDLMLEDYIPDKGAVGTDISIQQIPDPTVTVTMAGTAQQACQDK